MAPIFAALPAPPRSAARSDTEAAQPPPASCAVRRAACHAEVARDAQLVAESLRAALRHIAETALHPPPARAALARELHLCGDIWTIGHEGAVHVFGRPGSGADLILACERPRPDDPPPYLVALEARAS